MAKELYERIDRKIGDILADIKSGRVGLPDLQRPFVWKESKVRDLLDSMMSGFPVGYVMLWSAPNSYDHARGIGMGEKAYSRPTDLVIDGQQRLTSLLAALFGVEVIGRDFRAKRIRIAYQPLDNKFEVWSAAYERDTNWISDISTLFNEAPTNIYKYLRSVIARINEGRRRKVLPLLSEDEEDTIHTHVGLLLSLKDYILPTLHIKAEADEEQVAEIFRRVNSGGQNLNENNFIETLLAVYDRDIHNHIVAFASESRTPASGTAFNPIIKVEVSHLIRIAVGLGFRRARLRYAYKLLRGKDLETEEVSEDVRCTNLARFGEALSRATNLNNWHAYLNLFSEAGYLSERLISSNYVVVFGYVLYLVGKYDYKVPATELRSIISLWIFVSAVTSFYSSSPESTIEGVFADLRGVHSASDFVAYLYKQVDLKMTEDFFSVTLPENLKSSATLSPAWFGYLASLNVLGVQLLFSNTPASKYWELGIHGKKSSIDKHHIFPKNYLAKLGIKDNRDRNQIANFTYLDYTTNIDISDSPPAEYIARYRSKLGEEFFRRSLAENALMEGFEEMDYFTFLEERRKLMATMIKRAYLKLRGCS